MLSLRELLMNVRVDHHGTAVFLEAVVKALESQTQTHICSECRYFEPLQKRRCTVRPGYLVDVVGSTPACDQFSLSIASLGALHAELAEAKAEVEELGSDRDYWKKAYLGEREYRDKCKLRKELIKARGETERVGAQLRKDFAYWNERCRIAEDLVNTLRQDPDREIGRLVRGMRSHTRVIKGRAHYWPEALDEEHWSGGLGVYFDPIEALRAIQEKEPTC